MTEDKHILMINIPVPIPEIKKFSRWRVFFMLFNPKAHFTTCDTLQHKLYTETKAMAEIAHIESVYK